MADKKAETNGAASALICKRAPTDSRRSVVDRRRQVHRFRLSGPPAAAMQQRVVASNQLPAVPPFLPIAASIDQRPLWCNKRTYEAVSGTAVLLPRAPFSPQTLTDGAKKLMGDIVLGHSTRRLVLHLSAALARS